MMSSDPARTPEEDKLREAREIATEFIRKYGHNPSTASVEKLRKFIRSSRMVIDGRSGNRPWKEIPPYWPPDVPFLDINNAKPKKPELARIAQVLVDRMNTQQHSADVANSEPVPSTSRHQDPVEIFPNWDVKDQYRRITDRLHCPCLQLDGQLKNQILAIVGTWPLNVPDDRAVELEQLINQLIMTYKNQQLAEHFRVQLRAFADTSTQSELRAPVHVSSQDGQLTEYLFIDGICGIAGQIQDAAEIPQSVCDWNVNCSPTQDSNEEGCSMPMPSFDFREDEPEHQIMLKRVTNEEDCLMSIDPSLLMGNVMLCPTKEQAIIRGSHKEAHECMDAQSDSDKVLSENLAGKSSLGPEDKSRGCEAELDEFILQNYGGRSYLGPAEKVEWLKNFKKHFLEDEKMSDGPEVLPNTHLTDVSGVHVNQENFDMDKRLDDMSIGKYLACMQRDYPGVDAFPFVNYEKRLDYKLWKPLKDWKHWALIPVSYNEHRLLLAADKEEKTFCVLDSLPNKELAIKLGNWFKECLIGNSSVEWKRTECPCGQQKDANTCGDFLLMNAEAYVNQILHNTAQNLFRRCCLLEFRAWINWKLSCADNSKSIFHHLSLDVKSHETLCFICQEMHKAVVFRGLKPQCVT